MWTSGRYRGRRCWLRVAWRTKVHTTMLCCSAGRVILTIRVRILSLSCMQGDKTKEISDREQRRFGSFHAVQLPPVEIHPDVCDRSRFETAAADPPIGIAVRETFG